MSTTNGFTSATTSVADTKTQGERAFDAVVKAYDAFGSDPAVFGLLMRTLETHPLTKLGVTDTLKEIMAVLQDPEDAADIRLKKPVPSRPGQAFGESSSLTAEQADRIKLETSQKLEAARDSVQSEILGAVSGRKMGFSHSSNDDFHWVAENIKGGKAVQDAMPVIARTLFIVSDHVGRGLALDGAVAIGAQYAAGEKRLQRNHAIA